MEELKLDKNLIIKSSILLILLASIAIVEALTRENVFKFSLNFEKYLQSANSESLTDFFRIMSEIGNKYFYIPSVILIFLFCPLTKSFVFLSNLGMYSFS